MSVRSASWMAMIGALVTAGTLAFAGGAGASTSLPTLNVSVSGTKQVSVSGTAVSGAMKVIATGHGQYGLVRLNPGVSIQQAAGAVQSHHGDINALTPYGSLLVDASAPSTVETVLTPGSYVALNVTGNAPAFAPFTVSQSSAPAALPRAAAKVTAIEFAFRGPRVLHDGTMIRATNGGWLVHMIDLLGVPNAAAGRKVVSLLSAGKDNAARKFMNRHFVSLLGPASPGALQQQVLQAKPGYYVAACFMDTGDGREHTRLGMVRLVRVVK